MKSFLKKIVNFAKDHFGLTLGILSVSIVAIVILTTILSGGTQASGRWGKGITKGIPMPDDIKSVSVNVSDSYAAAYFEDVSSEEVSEYISLIEDKCDVVFTNDRFPRSAVSEDKIIVIHYNVTEKKLSVTVAAKGDNAPTVSGDQQ